MEATDHPKKRGVPWIEVTPFLGTQNQPIKIVAAIVSREQSCPPIGFLDLTAADRREPPKKSAQAGLITLFGHVSPRTHRALAKNI